MLDTGGTAAFRVWFAAPRLEARGRDRDGDEADDHAEDDQQAQDIEDFLIACIASFCHNLFA